MYLRTDTTAYGIRPGRGSCNPCGPYPNTNPERKFITDQARYGIEHKGRVYPLNGDMKSEKHHIEIHG
ncbi:MAG TPA: hypothetical protein PKG54_16485 [Phycisphaerae bacterium]|jgi:hypothetical protein|nr:hypothetical protein [Phycisphaerae bacterium]HOB76113.1 hypothetical protein [Phycisphaerae bacterium]HOJ56030.1 hypothetical protein [Phycisphaerae bacterium]HOL27101.1 hypothetical protein [Phycisphaerae bacterium]HPP21233.1 hypothetical protein [Phycisphaerae bacterium]